MGPILIQGAMDIEVSLLIKELDAVHHQNIGGFDFYKGTHSGHPIIISKTNIGMSNASCSTTIASLVYNPIAIINQGTAGGHSRDAHVGDIVVGLKTCNICAFEKSEMETGTDYTKWSHTDFRDHDFNADKGSSLIADKNLLYVIANTSYEKGKIHSGVIGSGDEWNKEVEYIEFLTKKLRTLCEDMETASVYNVASRFNIPVIGVRVISNNEVTHEPYQRESANNSQEFVIKCLDKIIEYYTNHH